MMNDKAITIGSCFSGIGCFEMAFENIVPSAKTVWQIEQNKFCQTILKKHWPNTILYDDIREVDAHALQPVDIVVGGFPCTDVSSAGKKKGVINGEKSGLWFEMWRICSVIRPPLIVLENVSAIYFRGLSSVLQSLAQIGYDAEWTSVSARRFGAPHLRQRWFCVAYPQRTRTQVQTQGKLTGKQLSRSSSQNRTISQWSQGSPVSPVCGVDDGNTNRVDRIKALGNAIVPQCVEYVAQCMLDAGMINKSRHIDKHRLY